MAIHGYDLFLRPKDPLISYDSLTFGAPNRFVSSGVLSGLSSLMFHAGVNVTCENIFPKCDGGL